MEKGENESVIEVVPSEAMKGTDDPETSKPSQFLTSVASRFTTTLLCGGKLGVRTLILRIKSLIQ